MTQSSFFQRYLLPGFVFQSVVIAGGYGTGRELVEFFLNLGPRGGLLAMAVSTLIWSAVCAASFELARLFGMYDYRSFFRRLLGPGWVLYEWCYFALMLLVLAVIAAAAGSILQESFGLPYLLGVVTILIAVGVLAFYGTAAIERFLAGWSFVLYGVYIVFFAMCLTQFGDRIGTNLGAGGEISGWFTGGVAYAAYNLALIPVLLFVVRHATSRRETIGAGLLAGPIAMIPALLFYLAMLGQYPAVLDETVPATFILGLLGSRAFEIVFQVVLFGTLIETGIGLIHGVNERLAARFEERGQVLPDSARSIVAFVLLILGFIVARAGLIGLIARGYGTLTWAFVVVFVIPVLTIGVWKIVQTRSEPLPAAGTVDAA